MPSRNRMSSGNRMPRARRIAAAARWRYVGAAVAVATAAGCGSAATGSVAAAKAEAGKVAAQGETVTFGYDGAHAQQVTVPYGVAWARVVVIGGHGGGTHDVAPSTVGGDGAEVSGEIPVREGMVLTLYVGGAGGRPTSTLGAGRGGWGSAELSHAGYAGNGGAAATSAVDDGGGGGGASSVQLTSHLFVIAGGGGGAGGRGLANGGDGGTVYEGGAIAGHKGAGAGAGKGGGGGTEPTCAGGTGGDGKWSGGGGGGGGQGEHGGGGGGGGGFGAGGGGGGGAGSWYFSSIVRNPKVTPGAISDGNGQIRITWTTSP
jgi:hypothetical protein